MQRTAVQSSMLLGVGFEVLTVEAHTLDFASLRGWSQRCLSGFRVPSLQTCTSGQSAFTLAMTKLRSETNVVRCSGSTWLHCGDSIRISENSSELRIVSSRGTSTSHGSYSCLKRVCSLQAVEFKIQSSNGNDCELRIQNSEFRIEVCVLGTDCVEPQHPSPRSPRTNLRTVISIPLCMPSKV